MSTRSTKRVEGEDVKKVMNIIDSQQKAFDYWRDEAQQFSMKFRIPLSIQKIMKTIYLTLLNYSRI